MRAAIVWTVVRREALEIVRNRLLVLSIVIPPIVLVVTPLVLGSLASVAATSQPLPAPTGPTWPSSNWSPPTACSSSCRSS